MRAHNETLAPRPPVEIIRVILEVAATQSRSTASTLVCVSKEVHRWIIPIILHTVTLKREKLEAYRGLGIMSMIRDKTRELANHVRILHLDFGFNHEDFDRDTYDAYNEIAWLALRRCVRVERLVLAHWSEEYGQDEKVARINPCAEPWDVRMVQDNPSLMMDPSSFPYMRNVTHFYYGKDDFFLHEMGLFFSDFLDNITHLAVAVVNFTSSDSPPEAIPDTLESWLSRPSLKVFYVEYLPWSWSADRRSLEDFPDPEEIWGHLLAVEDRRFCMGTGLQNDLECLVEENGRTVWQRVSAVRFKNWKETVMLNECITTTNA